MSADFFLSALSCQFGFFPQIKLLCGRRHTYSSDVQSSLVTSHHSFRFVSSFVHLPPPCSALADNGREALGRKHTPIFTIHSLLLAALIITLAISVYSPANLSVSISVHFSFPFSLLFFSYSTFIPSFRV